MNTCTRRTEFAKQSTVALALWASIVSRKCFSSDYTSSMPLVQCPHAVFRIRILFKIRADRDLLLIVIYLMKAYNRKLVCCNR